MPLMNGRNRAQVGRFQTGWWESTYLCSLCKQACNEINDDTFLCSDFHSFAARVASPATH
jgi:hypothetical protein